MVSRQGVSGRLAEQRDRWRAFLGAIEQAQASLCEVFLLSNCHLVLSAARVADEIALCPIHLDELRLVVKRASESCPYGLGKRERLNKMLLMLVF